LTELADPTVGPPRQQSQPTEFISQHASWFIADRLAHIKQIDET
jgi:hypothetical protein